MPKVTLAQVNQLIKQRSFFESFRLNYGSYSAAGRELGISGKTLEELAKAPRGYSPSDKRLKDVQKAIGKMSRGNYQVATRFAYVQHREGMTPGQLKYAEKYAANSSTGQRYFRKAVNDFYNNKTKRVLMPALRADGKIVNSPKTKKTRRGSSGGKRRAIRRRRR
jgi:hypothetical protein